jgi:hypothetical protein
MEKIELKEQILEIRFKPKIIFFDIKGRIAEDILKHMNLNHWRIGENRIDAFAEDKSEIAFVSFNNLGYVIRNAPTANYFKDKIVKFIKKISDIYLNDNNEIYVDRIGVRYRSCIGFDGDFDKLLNNYMTNYLQISDRMRNTLQADIIDIGGNLNFKDKYGNFNTASGPMWKDQILQFFSDVFNDEKSIPEVGLYTDVDYWNMPQKPISIEDIMKHVKQLADASIDKSNIIKDIVMNNN